MKRILILMVVLFLIVLPFALPAGEIFKDCRASQGGVTTGQCDALTVRNESTSAPGICTENANGTIDCFSTNALSANLAFNFSEPGNNLETVRINFTVHRIEVDELIFGFDDNACALEVNAAGQLYTATSNAQFSVQCLFDNVGDRCDEVDNMELAEEQQTNAQPHEVLEFRWNQSNGLMEVYNLTTNGSFTFIASDTTTLTNNLECFNVYADTRFSLANIGSDFDLTLNGVLHFNGTSPDFAPPADTTPPTVDSTAIDDTTPFLNDGIQISAKFTDETALSFIFYANNISGTFTNLSSIDVTGELSTNFTVNITNTLTAGNVVGSLFTGNDTSGNSIQSSVILYVVGDSSNPGFLTDSINDSSVRRNEVVNVSIEATDNVALGVILFAHNLSGTLTNVSQIETSATIFNASFAFQPDLIRTHQVAYQFTINDSVGNSNQTQIFQFEIQNTVPLIPTILFPTPEGLVTFLQPMDINITFAEDADLDGLKASYYINDILNQTSFTNTTFNASDGVFNLKVSIDDGFASSPNASITFTLDTINPIITISSPANNTLHSKDITVDLICTNINLQNVSYSFSNETDITQEVFNATTDVTLSGIRTPISVAGLGDDSYNLNVTCTDNATNVNRQFLILNLDQTIPAISVGLNNNTPEISDLIQYSANCTDVNGIGLFAVENNVTGSFVNQTTVNVNNETPFEFTFNHTAVNETVSTIFTCEDAVQNSIQSSAIVYSSTSPAVDIIPPIVDSTAISNATPQEDDVISINVTCTDTFSGMANISVANNASATLTNISVFTFLNETTAVTLEFNHTAVFGFIAHQFTCSDALANEIQSGFVNYNSTELPSVPLITALAILPLESAGSIVGMVALLIIVLGLLGFKLARKGKK